LQIRQHRFNLRIRQAEVGHGGVAFDRLRIFQPLSQSHFIEPLSHTGQIGCLERAAAVDSMTTPAFVSIDQLRAGADRVGEIDRFGEIQPPARRGDEQLDRDRNQQGDRDQNRFALHTD
jgi:hypothetical protein